MPGAGLRLALGTGPAELYQSGFYVQSARLVDCEAERCRKAGFLCMNQEAGGLVLERCRDAGSACGLVIEYGWNRARIEGFVSDGAPRLAVQSCMNVHQLLASLREAYQSIVIVEYDDGIFSSLEGEDRDVIFAVGRTLRELARSCAVLLCAPRGGDRGLVWFEDEPPSCHEPGRGTAVAPPVAHYKEERFVP